MEIRRVTTEELEALVPLMEAYCDFYGTDPGPEKLRSLAESLLADPDHEGFQLIATVGGRPVGFATVYWLWSTVRAARIGLMNDLYVDPAARGTGVAEALIRASADEARAAGAVRLWWQTAPDNERAQAVYDRVGARRESWQDYSLSLTG
jgi:GNAT superfamily N-acetyltransferase